MKRISAFILSVILCFLFCSCTDIPTVYKPDMIIGTWTFINGYTLTFNEDSTGKMVSMEEVYFTWSYSEENDCYECTMENGKPFEVTYQQKDNGQTVIYAWDTPGVKTSEFFIRTEN